MIGYAAFTYSIALLLISLKTSLIALTPLVIVSVTIESKVYAFLFFSIGILLKFSGPIISFYEYIYP